jgi:aspartokinase
MPTVAHIVKKIIERKPFVQEALSRGILNNAALAEELTPVIEKELGKKVKFSAVNMAIRRLAEKLEKTFVIRPKFNKKSDITIKSDLVAITLYKDEIMQKDFKKLYEIINIKSGDLLTITQGFHEIMLVINRKNRKKILKLFPKSSIKKMIKSLSSLTINVPIESIRTIGLFYSVTRSLTAENINIVDIVSTLTEMTFILDENDTARAFDILQRLIKENR